VYLLIILVLFQFNWNQLNSTNDNNNNNNSNTSSEPCYLRIYGNILEEKSIPYSAMVGNNYTRIENDPYEFLNSVGTRYNATISGVSLYSILIYYSLLTNTSRYIQFEADDGYKSPKLPLSILIDHPNSVLIATHENGVTYKAKAAAGDGPLVSAVRLDVIQNNQEVKDFLAEIGRADFVYNTAYKVKYLTAIYVV